MKYIGKHPDYDMVYEYTNGGGRDLFWAGKVSIKRGREQVTAQKFFTTAREAAMFVDLRLIEHGKDPVNILKKA